MTQNVISSCNRACNQIFRLNRYFYSTTDNRTATRRRIQAGNRRRVVGQFQVGIAVGRQPGIRMPGQLLGQGEADASAAQIADERVAVGMEVRKQPLLVLIEQEIAPLTLGPFVARNGFREPAHSGLAQVVTHHLGGLAKMSLGRVQVKQGLALFEISVVDPTLQPGNDVGMQRNLIVTTPFAVTGSNGDFWRRFVKVARRQSQ